MSEYRFTKSPEEIVGWQRIDDKPTPKTRPFNSGPARAKKAAKKFRTLLRKQGVEFHEEDTDQDIVFRFNVSKMPWE